jgi:hypothetical protein
MTRAPQHESSRHKSCTKHAGNNVAAPVGVAMPEGTKKGTTSAWRGEQKTGEMEHSRGQ